MCDDKLKTKVEELEKKFAALQGRRNSLHENRQKISTQINEIDVELLRLQGAYRELKPLTDKVEAKEE